MIALESEIQQALATFYGNRVRQQHRGRTRDRSSWTCRVRRLDLQDQSTQTSASSIVDRILAKGASDRASDIHIEPSDSDVSASAYRIDGMLHEVDGAPRRCSRRAVVARIKIMAGMDIAEHRLPQDGRISVTIDGKQRRPARLDLCRRSAARRS